MARLAQEMLDETSSDLEMTPMIDVTFLLLIFFLCATSFKAFENKLETYLPKNGPSPATRPDEQLPTEIKLRHAGTGDRGVEIRMGSMVVGSFAELRQRLEQRHDSAEKKRELPVNIYGTDQVAWEHVVTALDTARGVGIQQVQFAVSRDNDGITFGR